MEHLKHWLETRKSDDRTIVILLIKGYLLLTLFCFLILYVPFTNSSENTIYDHILFSVSIVSTTGLAPSSFSGSFNFLGQIFALIFIQLGGIGYMALSSFIILKQFNHLPTISAKLLRFEFNLPKKYPLTSFIYSVFIFTILIETIGACILYFGFLEEGVEQPIWNAIFHSVSAFCTAGFSLFDDSMVSFKNNTLITNTILVLSLLGSIGFIVLLDFWLLLIRKRKHISLSSEIILISTFLFVVISTLLTYFSENDLYGSGWEGFKFSLFQCISAHTTVGFNNYDIGSMNSAGIFILIILMIIGASPAGTGGGIKTTSVTALVAVLYSVLKRKEYVSFSWHEIPAPNIYLAISSLIFYTFIFIIGTWGILIFDGNNFSLEKILFEASSALSTVGLSTGITGELSNSSKIIISLLMFIGRLGVLTFGFALISKAPLIRNKLKQEDIAI